MIYGNINNEFFDQQAAILPRPLGDALRYLKENDFTNREEGRSTLVLNGVEMILSVMDRATKAREAARPEIHRKYIDVQFIVSGGPEKATYYNDDGSNAVQSDQLATDKDILFYENNPDVLESSVYLTPGTYAVYLPWDIHVPGQSVGDAPAPFRKVVIKVPMEACL